LGENPEENEGFEIGGAESGSVGPDPAPLLPRALAELIQAWPTLRPEIRAAIVALLQTGRA